MIFEQQRRFCRDFSFAFGSHGTLADIVVFFLNVTQIFPPVRDGNICVIRKINGEAEI